MLHLRQDHLVRLRHARRRRPGERAAPAAVHLPLTWPPAAPACPWSARSSTAPSSRPGPSGTSA